MIIYKTLLKGVNHDNIKYVKRCKSRKDKDYMYRKYIIDLEKWLVNPRRKPLIVWGARQVGKSYLVKDIFAETYFKNNYIYIDCRTDYKFVDYCQNHVNAQDVLNYISLDHNKIIDKNTLIIFDEVQECLPLITLMKYFCQDYQEIPLIVTGSMVRIKIQRENKKKKSNDKFMFPVGKINQLTIYPLDFEEFFINRNKILYDNVCKSFENKKTIDLLVHQKSMDLFYDYLLIGGMPEVVDVFIKTNSYQEARNVLKDLYDNYLGDMDLYQASPESIIRAKKIFENIFSQLNKENKNFKSSLIEKNAKNRDLKNPIDWLELAFLVNKCSLVKEVITIPLIDSNESLYRLYLSDMGLFSYQSKINPTTFISNNSRNTLSGIFFENYVAIELINYGYKLFYWKGKNNAEFEFVIENDSKIIPLDVKKNKGSLNSLEKFKEHNKLDYAIKISSNNYGYDENNKIITIPFYELFLLLKDLSKNDLK